MQIIRRVHNLLTPGGLFAFSAHNRDWKYAGGHPVSKPLRPRNIVDALHPMSWVNYLSRRKLRREEADYAILNDEAHRWQGVFYYITPDAQARQLESGGLEFSWKHSPKTAVPFDPANRPKRTGRSIMFAASADSQLLPLTR
jgi:hypothetical protein